jgi:cytochrome c-type biogenesis protein CcmH
MLTFWLIAAALILVGVAVVAIPLLRGAPSKSTPSGDQMNVLVFQDHLAELEADVESGILSADQFEQGRLELERRLLEETSSRPDEDRPQHPSQHRRGLALFLGLCLPALTFALYAQLGRIDLLSGSPPVAAPEAPHPVSDTAIGQLVETLANRLAVEPNDPRGWMMLGRSYAALKEYPKAVDAYRRARVLVGDQPDLLVAYADALLMASDGRFDPQTVTLIERALEVDAKHVKALWLAGTIAHQQGDYAKALEIWERLAAQAPEGSDLARTMAANIAEARALLADAEPQ